MKKYERKRKTRVRHRVKRRVKTRECRDYYSQTSSSQQSVSVFIALFLYFLQIEFLQYGARGQPVCYNVSVTDV